MIRIDKEVIIDAPIENVFNYVTEPRNLPEIWPGLIQVFNIEELPGGGYSAEYEVKVAGIRFNGKGKFTEFVPNQWIVINTRGISHSTITCTFRSIDKNTDIEKTRFTLTLDYEIPIPVFGHLAEYVVTRMNEHEADLVMANLQTRLMRQV
ncbi:MAG: SRPBCC family protein [Dehalococcoidales bacterium]|nr:SRPBCC family protein [Dehalococcoidales bacterium]